MKKRASTKSTSLVDDPYRWLENEQSPRAQRWIRAQNTKTSKVLRKLPLRPCIARRLKQLYRTDFVGLPIVKKGKYFTWERRRGQELSALYVRDTARGKKRVVIDENKLPKSKGSVRSISLSSDGKLMVYGLSRNANDQQSLHVMHVATRKNLKDVIPEDLYPAAHSDIAWHPDGTGFWYTRRWHKAPKHEQKLHQKLYFHRLGDPWNKDTLVFGEKLEKQETPSPKVGAGGRWLIVATHSSHRKKRRTSVHIKDLTKPTAPFHAVVKNLDAIFDAWYHNDVLYGITNHRAPNWKIVKLSLANGSQGKKTWKTVIPEGNFPLEEVRCVGDRLFVVSLENVASVIRMYDLNGNPKGTLGLPGLGTVIGISGRPYGTEFFFSFTSFTTPSQVYRYDLKTGRTSLVFKPKTAFKPKDFVVRQVWYRSKDKTRIPMFLVHKKGLRRTGKNPVVLYGYGGFNINLTSTFQFSRIPFLERDGIFAIPNLRGGGEFGEKWHRAGMREKKQNVFDDFIAAAEWLIRSRYTDKAHIASMGASNGGLLVGAMITQRPDLFKANVADVPVMDMMRFHKFHGGVHWVRDYGNPDDPREAKYLLKYSPYHNLKKGVRYPSSLIMTAVGDDRVHPLHAYKFAARLLEMNASEQPILLRVETRAGHSGGAAVTKIIESAADRYAYIAWQLGME